MPAIPPLRIGLLFSAVYLTHEAQKVLSEPLEQVYDRLLARRWITGRARPEHAHRCTLFAASVMSRFGYDTGCLTRSLVTARLLCRTPGVELHIGFHDTGSTEPRTAPLGHAWVTLAGANLSDSREQALATRDIRTTRSISMYRPL